MRGSPPPHRTLPHTQLRGVPSHPSESRRVSARGDFSDLEISRRHAKTHCEGGVGCGTVDGGGREGGGGGGGILTNGAVLPRPAAFPDARRRILALAGLPIISGVPVHARNWHRERAAMSANYPRGAGAAGVREEGRYCGDAKQPEERNVSPRPRSAGPIMTSPKRSRQDARRRLRY